MLWLTELYSEHGELCLAAYASMLMDFRHQDTAGFGLWVKRVKLVK